MSLLLTAGELVGHAALHARQLDEVEDMGEMGSMYSHIGIASDDWDTVIERAVARGCTQYADKKHWFDMPDGFAIELKKPRE